MTNGLKTGWHITKETFKKFANDRPLDYAAIIGFYTIFSLPALLIIMIRVAGSFFGQEAVKGQLVGKIGGIVGRSSAKEIQSIIENATQSSASGIGTVLGIVTMLVTSTTVFVALQDALNGIWSVKAKPEKGWLKLIVNRLLSLALLISFGFLLLVSLLTDVVLGVISDYLQGKLSGGTVYLMNAGQFVVSILLSIIIFASLFKVLPDVEIKWKNVWIGATVTAILFSLGKYLINFFLQHDPLADAYGAAASLVLLLVWVFYSSIVFLLGAEFTLVYAQETGHGIKPSDHAVKVRTVEVESEA